MVLQPSTVQDPIVGGKMAMASAAKTIGMNISEVTIIGTYLPRGQGTVNK